MRFYERFRAKEWKINKSRKGAVLGALTVCAAFYFGERGFGTRPIKLRVHNQNALTGKAAHTVNALRSFPAFVVFKQKTAFESKKLKSHEVEDNGLEPMTYWLPGKYATVV